MWVRNSMEIMLLICCLYTELAVLGMLARSRRIFGEGNSHGGVDGRIG